MQNEDLAYFTDHTENQYRVGACSFFLAGVSYMNFREEFCILSKINSHIITIQPNAPIIRRIFFSKKPKSVNLQCYLFQINVTKDISLWIVV